MHNSIPAGAALLLGFIPGFQSNRHYQVIFGHYQDQRPGHITAIALHALRSAQDEGERVWKSNPA